MTTTTIAPAQAGPALQRIRPEWIGRTFAGIACALILVYPLISDDRYYQNMIIISLVFAIGASGLNIMTGFAGYVSLGQSAFIGLGGYTIGVLATRFDSLSPGCGFRWPVSSRRWSPRALAWSHCVPADRHSSSSPWRSCSWSRSSR